MRGADREAVVHLYEERFARLGYDVQTVGWRSRAEQRLRFQILCDMADLSGCSICDVGCGFGDLLPYLRERFTDFTYTGVDIAPSLVRAARERHPAVPFHCLDILDEPFEDRFDYFLLSGALNFRVADNERLTEAMLRRMFSLANRGVAVNCLTTFVNYQHTWNYHHDPVATFCLARQLARWVVLRHDYPLWEFTLYLYRHTVQRYDRRDPLSNAFSP